MNKRAVIRGRFLLKERKNFSMLKTVSSRNRLLPEIENQAEDGHSRGDGEKISELNRRLNCVL
jgi:hypothetical protein